MELVKLYEQILCESKNSMILYHGLSRKFDDFEDIITGMWFATDLNSEIMEWYKNRGNGYIIVNFTPKRKIIDLSDFDVDEFIDSENVEDFISDVLMDLPNASQYIEKSYRKIYIEGEIPPRYDNENFENGYYTYSEILNWLITNILIKNKNIFSGVIVNEAGHETIAVFNTDELNLIEKVENKN